MYVFFTAKLFEWIMLSLPMMICKYVCPISHYLSSEFWLALWWEVLSSQVEAVWRQQAQLFVISNKVDSDLTVQNYASASVQCITIGNPFSTLKKDNRLKWYCTVRFLKAVMFLKQCFWVTFNPTLTRVGWDWPKK